MSESWSRCIRVMRATPAQLRRPDEVAALEAAEQIRAVAQDLRGPECRCCEESVQQMERAAVLLEGLICGR